MNVIIISRIIGFIFFGIIGAVIGTPINNFISSIWPANPLSVISASIALGLILGAFGFLIAPWISIKPIQALRKIFNKASAHVLMSGLLGLIVGLITAALLAYPLSLLPQPFGGILPFVGVLLFGYLGIVLFVTRQNDFLSVIRGSSGKGLAKGSRTQGETEHRILVDTSAIIDGRIADIAKTGFLPGSLIIPRFVLNELQYVSDSADSMRRQRGRRGIEILAELQKGDSVPVTISDVDVEGVREVDDRLVILARQLSCPILTNDYNLNRIADLQGVQVLNINELANAVKTILMPGESLQMKIIQEGKEYGQGVGYMEDGTMVVIENGQHYLNQTIKVSVTKVLQTSAGRMIFAKPDNDK